ncbi:MAG TPA: hypothetical protein VF007_02850, partial [Stellaceae bacterium]
MEFDEERFAPILGQIAGAVRSGAASAARTPGWRCDLSLPFGFFDRKEPDCIHIGRSPCRAAVGDELVKLYLNLDPLFPALDRLFNLLAMELEPFIIGVGEVRADLLPEGVVLIRRENRKDHCAHGDAPDDVRQTDNCPVLMITEAALHRAVSESISVWCDDDVTPLTREHLREEIVLRLRE